MAEYLRIVAIPHVQSGFGGGRRPFSLGYSSALAVGGALGAGVSDASTMMGLVLFGVFAALRRERS